MKSLQLIEGFNPSVPWFSTLSSRLKEQNNVARCYFSSLFDAVYANGCDI